MKKIINTFLFFLIFASCSNKKHSTVDNGESQADKTIVGLRPDISSTVDNDKTQASSLKQKFIPILNGVWVLADYIAAIEHTKSPSRAADKLQGVVTMIIDAGIKSDSVEVGVSWNNHEGTNFTTYFIAGQNLNSLKTNLVDYDEKSNYYDLGYETISNETFLVLYHYNKANKLIDKKKFIKVAEKEQDSDASWGLQYIVNEKLFSGNYLLIDSTNTSTKITFKNNGSLTGHSDFKTYYVLTDFMGGPKTILDGIVFNIYEKNSKWFAFIIENDTTYLYSTIGDEEAGELLQLDKIQYKLVRQYKKTSIIN